MKNQTLNVKPKYHKKYEYDIDVIKDMIENKLGIVDLKSYEQYKNQKHETGLTEEEIQSLSPDNIPSDKFWEWTAQSEFEKDTIIYGLPKDADPEQCNKKGWHIALLSGCLNYFLTIVNLQREFDILEIGPGYGSFKQMCENTSNINYFGVDVYPRIPGVYKIADGDTLLPDEISSRKYDLVFSSNVFQHLSPRQRLSYYRQVKDALLPGGIFSFNTIVLPRDEDIGFACGQKRYVCHYGQYVEIETEETYIQNLSPFFDIIAASYMKKGYISTYHCTPKIGK